MDDASEEEGPLGDHRVIYRDGRSGTSAIHAVPLAPLRVCLHERGWDHQWLNLTPLMTTTKSALSHCKGWAGDYLSSILPYQVIPTVK